MGGGAAVCASLLLGGLSYAGITLAGTPFGCTVLGAYLVIRF